MARKRIDWQQVIDEVNARMLLLKHKPASITIGYQCSPEGILNAYREGDLTFKQAVRELEKWKRGMR